MAKHDNPNTHIYQKESKKWNIYYIDFTSTILLVTKQITDKNLLLHNFLCKQSMHTVNTCIKDN